MADRRRESGLGGRTPSRWGAAALLLAASTSWAAAAGAPSPCETPALSRLRDLIRKEGKFGEAEQEARRLLSGQTASHGADSIQAACAIDVLVESLRHSGKLKEDEPLVLARKAVRIKQGRLGSSHPELASSFSNLGWVLRGKGRLAEACTLLQSALSVWQKALPAESIEIAWGHENLGSCLSDLGRYREARSHIEEGLRITALRKGPLDSELAGSHYNLARLLYRLGLVDEALSHYVSALSIVDRPGAAERHRAVSILNNIGSLHDESGRHVEALEWNDRALAMARARAAEAPLVLAQCLNNRGRVYRNLGDLDAARAAFEEALALARGTLGSEHQLSAAILENLGHLDVARGARAEAKQRLEEALLLRERLQGPDHPYCGAAHEGIAAVLLAEGAPREALERFRKAHEIQRKGLPAGHPDIARALAGMGASLAEMGLMKEARAHYDEAVGIMQAALGPAHPGTGLIIAQRVALALRAGDPLAALADAFEAEKIGRDHARLMLAGLSEDLALRYVVTRPEGLDVALTIASRREGSPAVERVWDTLIRSRALVLDEMVTRYAALARAEARVPRSIRERLAAAQRRLAQLTIRGADPDAGAGWDTILKDAAAEVDRLERELASVSAPYRRLLAERRIGLQQVREALPEDTALLAFARYDNQGVPSYLALVLGPQRAEPVAIPLGVAGAIEPIVEKWAGAVRDPWTGTEPEKAYRQVAWELRRRVWDPVAPDLRGARRLFIVPDGSLNLVDFGALPDGEAGYLVESAPLMQQIPAERDLARGGRPARPGEGLLAVGGPSFDDTSLFASLASRDASPKPAPEMRLVRVSLPEAGPSRGSCGAMRSARFEDLPGSRREAQEIAELWQGGSARRPGAGVSARVLTGSEASEAAFKKSAPGRSVIHLATHGFFLGDRCQTSPMDARSASLGPPDGPPPPAGRNPLFYAGLAFAGANHREEASESEEDGILTAAEIASIDLSKTDLAVLAGCETGVGRVEVGEGVLGLRRAFRIAGVRTVVMSLWNVEDAAARDWMTRLYRRRPGASSTAEAVRATSLEVLEALRASGRGTHPYHWAGWIVSGA
jgi:CHAT domain-containing protein/tetratricopeptide (TPR) repeat protein